MKTCKALLRHLQKHTLNTEQKQHETAIDPTDVGQELDPLDARTSRTQQLEQKVSSLKHNLLQEG